MIAVSLHWPGSVLVIVTRVSVSVSSAKFCRRDLVVLGSVGQWSHYNLYARHSPWRAKCDLTSALLRCWQLYMHCCAEALLLSFLFPLTVTVLMDCVVTVVGLCNSVVLSKVHLLFFAMTLLSKFVFVFCDDAPFSFLWMHFALLPYSWAIHWISKMYN